MAGRSDANIGLVHIRGDHGGTGEERLLMAVILVAAQDAQRTAGGWERRSARRFLLSDRFGIYADYLALSPPARARIIGLANGG